MCDNRNDLHKFEYEKSKDNTSTRLDLDISETTDSYPEFDFLDLLRKLQVKEKKPKLKSGNEECTNKSSVFSEEDSDVETLARLYEEKYGTCNDYAELGEGYDEEDSFIDNSDAVNDLVPNGIQTEFGGFYINRGKLNFVKEDNSSSSTSEDVDKFLAHNRLNTRKIVSDDENEEKECKTSSSNQYSSNVTAGNTSNNIINHNNNNNNNYHNVNSSNSNNNNSSNVNNNQSSNNNNGSFHNNIAKSRKRSGEFQHKSKKIRKTATPKIPDHLLLKKPFPGSLEYRKNIKEFKKNRLKSIEADKKPAISNFIVNSRNNSVDNNTTNNHSNNVSSVNIDNCEESKEDSLAKRKPTVKEVSREREVLGADVSEKQTSSSSETSDSSSSGDSDSDSSDDTSVEKERIGQKPDEAPHLNAAINGSISKEITAKSFAHLSDSLKDLIAKINEISKEEKNKLFNSKLNPLLVSLDDRLRELPMAERNAVLDHIAEILQMKKDNITKRTKKLLVLQEETKMSGPLRKLKEAIATMMPLLESNYFNEYTKAAGTRSIDSNSLPQRKFPWNDELRHYLREIVQFRKNCYYIIRPRKESLIDYIRNFMEIKVKTFWPKEWMSVDILLEEAQVTSPRQPDEKQKAIPKISGSQTSSSIMQKKTSTSVSMPNVPNKKASASATLSSTVLIPPNNRKSSQGALKNSEVKSILIPRKVPQGTNTSVSPSKQNFSSSSSSLQNSLSGSRLQVTLNRLNVQEYLDRVSGSQTSICRNSNQQISPNRSQKSVSPNRLLKTSSPNSVLNSNAIRPSLSKATSPNSANKTISTVRNCTNSQSVLKTIEIHSNPLPGLKTSPNSVTISPVNESIFKEISPSSEVLNLTKNSSVFISKVKDCGESKTGRSNSPSLGIPLPSGITISPTNPAPSTFLAKPQKQLERNSDVKINVSIMKQDTPISLTKDKRETMLNMNVKREGPLQNIPDCISVTSKVVQNERHKYEHVRKRALHEYQQQQQQQQQLSPERLKSEEKKMKPDENLLSDMDIKDDKLDDKNFSKIFESVIAKTSETVRQSECTTSQIKQEKFGNSNLDSVTSSGGIAVRIPSVGMNQFKNNPLKLGDIRSRKDKPFLLAKNEGCVLEEGNYKEGDEKSDSMKEQLVQMEMDRVMQNLVELSREKNSEYEYETQHSGYSAGSSALKPSRYQEAFQKVLFK